MLSLVHRGKVEHLGPKVLIVEAVVKVGSRESLSVPLQRVNLLNLTPIWKSDVLDTKVGIGIVLVGRDLA